jgi:hypothetical protein
MFPARPGQVWNIDDNENHCIRTALETHREHPAIARFFTGGEIGNWLSILQAAGALTITPNEFDYELLHAVFFLELDRLKNIGSDTILPCGHTARQHRAILVAWAQQNLYGQRPIISQFDPEKYIAAKLKEREKSLREGNAESIRQLRAHPELMVGVPKSIEEIAADLEAAISRKLQAEEEEMREIINRRYVVVSDEEKEAILAQIQASVKPVPTENNPTIH